jgi:hypothetical protein
MLCLTLEQRKHGLVALVYTIKITNRQGAHSCNVKVVETAKNLHVSL